ncbi:MAG: aminotransferase class I/II-fold pyridoxal phosphate-dependent enzyme, partial [Deltaproteobacteria bacterium]
MMQLRITHETCYDYAPAVDIAQHMAYLQPLNNSHQHLLSHSLLITPEPAQQIATQDVYGNTRQFFSLQASHTQLKVTANSVVSTQACPMPESEIGWEEVRERFRYCAKKPFDAAAEFVFTSPYVPRHAEFAAYARPSFSPGRPLLQAARDLMQRIHLDFTYESQSTQVNTPALVALEQRKGVCQDFAHIMIACLRANGVPVLENARSGIAALGNLAADRSPQHAVVQRLAGNVHRRLRCALARHHGLDPDQLLPGNGAAELFTWAARDAAAAGCSLLPAPGFADYQRALACWGGAWRDWPLPLQWPGPGPQAFPPGSGSGGVGAGQEGMEAGALWITNPHNPTGQLWSRASLEPLLE